MKILILNGPNLNLLGLREPDIYGDITMDEYLGQLHYEFPDLELHFFQSNHEGDLIDKLHEYGFSSDGIIFNAGAYTHTSLALADAVRSIKTPVIEMHISDIYTRETIRSKSFLADVCQHQVNGKGMEGYKIAVKYLMDLKPDQDTD
ncbi:MAG: 3-dehydroquinate dehydratase [Saprospiraceae bacterium]|nr:3-dehydroquinate dehydratase [Saprospiraceae bacterium]